jgi:H+-translocating NAD(P) transhydrogenase subunit beta
VIELFYVLAASAFIVGLRWLQSPRSARRGNAVASAGMLLAVVVTLVDQDIVDWYGIAAGLVVGMIVGGLAARRAAMTAMPQLVAALNGSGGAASVLVALSVMAGAQGRELTTAVLISVAFSLVIGGVTASGSALALAKLQGLVPGTPVATVGVRLGGSATALGLLAASAATVAGGSVTWAWVVAGIALAAGVLFVLPIGGGDMPVVISLLNAGSGLAAAATGFVIDNHGLIIAGALVGSAGLILTRQMCDAMNRSLRAVLVGGFGGATAIEGTGGGDVRRTTAGDVAIALGYAESVVVVPGYGLAVAQAQHALRRLVGELEDRGVSVSYAVHPVAGRMPGHMNVLLAEAEVPYRQLLELEQANAMLAHTDVVLVIGANDVVNTSARDDPDSPIFGMPVLEVDRANAVVVVKRSLSPGFAGIDNPLFHAEGTQMLLADARDALDAVTSAMSTV